MTSKSNIHKAGLMGLIMAGSFLILIGCSKNDTTASSNTASASSGQAAFNTNCAKCHGTNGSGGRAPDLSHFGADPTHTAQWIAEYVKNPQSKDPNSRMPKFEGRISDSDLQAVSGYVAGLK